MPEMQSLRVSPRVLDFAFQPGKSVSIDLSLTNVTDRRIAFKIKTTAPKAYIVRPSTGVLEARSERNVQIIMQPMTTEPSACNDRFLVQAIQVDNEADTLGKEFWNSVDKNRMEDQRLSVVITSSRKPSLSNVGVVGTVVSGGGVPNQKYEELVKYAAALESTARELRKERDALREELDGRNNREATATGTAADAVRSKSAGNDSVAAAKANAVQSGFAAWQVVLIVILSILGLKLAGLVHMGPTSIVTA